MKPELIPEILVLGIIVAGLYGLLPIAIVLTYRISRTIGFVHGGIAIAGGLGYKVLANGQDNAHDFLAHPVFPPMADLFIIVGGGALIGALYGGMVMSRWMASLPGITLTVISISGLLVVSAAAGYFLRPVGASVSQSAFGDGAIGIGKVYLTNNRLATMSILVALVLGLTLFLNRTYTGLAIRAIADDVEASVWCGARLRLIGTGVYGLSGAISAMTGALFVASVAEAVDGMLVLFARGLVIAVVGGLRSVSLALLGALLYGILETALIVEFFGPISAGGREVALSGALLALIVVVARYRKESFFLLERQQL